MPSTEGFICVLLFQLIPHIWACKSADDSALFRIDWKLRSATPKHLLGVNDDWLTNKPHVHITSDNNEKYLCALPVASAQGKKKVQSYVGPSAAELISSLYENRVCSYWLDIYWTYELCHGRYVLQYHEERNTQRSRNEYYLGNYYREQSKLDDKKFDELNPPKRKIDNKEQPYYPVTYKQGTVCDLTGKPRKTVVMYSCHQDAKDQIHSFAEIASCTYEVIVLTKRLCSHPSFRPSLITDNAIVCYSKDPNQEHAKPVHLIQLEKESQTAFEKEYISFFPLGLPQTPNAGFKATKDANMEEEDLDVAVAVPKQTQSAFKPTFDMDQLFEGSKYFLNGKHCLYGGGGSWWKYEFCYGKSVKQFHDSPESQRIEILLGLFNEEIHKHWINDNPQKKPLKIGGRITQVSHLYAGGAFCEQTDTHRSVEVRIRCQTTEGSPTAVSLYLLEPHTCQYVLGVESPGFCDLLQNVDQYGLIQLPESKIN